MRFSRRCYQYETDEKLSPDNDIKIDSNLETRRKSVKLDFNKTTQRINELESEIKDLKQSQI